MLEVVVQEIAGTVETEWTDMELLHGMGTVEMIQRATIIHGKVQVETIRWPPAVQGPKVVDGNNSMAETIQWPLVLNLSDTQRVRQAVLHGDTTTMFNPWRLALLALAQVSRGIPSQRRLSASDQSSQPSIDLANSKL